MGTVSYLIWELLKKQNVDLAVKCMILLVSVYFLSLRLPRLPRTRIDTSPPPPPEYRLPRLPHDI